jgi:hypothetical protein
MPKVIKTSKGSLPEPRVDESLRDRVLPDVEERLRLFDEALHRQREREKARPLAEEADRGWTREDLYRRGRAD